MHSPRECHMDVVQGILRYLKSTPRKGFLFKKISLKLYGILTTL